MQSSRGKKKKVLSSYRPCGVPGGKFFSFFCVEFPVMGNSLVTCSYGFPSRPSSVQTPRVLYSKSPHPHTPVQGVPRPYTLYQRVLIRNNLPSSATNPSLSAPSGFRIDSSPGKGGRAGGGGGVDSSSSSHADDFSYEIQV